MASRSLGTLFVDLLMKTAGFETDAGRAARVAEQTSKRISTASIAVGVAMGEFLMHAGEGIAHAIEAAASFGNEMGEMAQKVGISVGELSALKVVADQSSLSMEDFQTGIDKFSKTAAAAASGAKLQAEQFKALGINIRDASGHLKPADVLLDETAKKFAGMKDSNVKTADAMLLFGKSGANLIPFLNRLGNEGLDGATAAAKRFGTYLDGDAKKAADDYKQNMVALHEIVFGFEILLTNALTPALSAIIGLFVDFSTKTSTAADRTEAMRTGVLDVAGVLISFAALVQKATVYVAGFADRLGVIGGLMADTPIKRIMGDYATMAANPLPWKKWAAADDLQAVVGEQKKHLADAEKAWTSTWKNVDESIKFIDDDAAAKIAKLLAPVPKSDAGAGGGKDAPDLPVGGSGNPKKAKIDQVAESYKALNDQIKQQIDLTNAEMVANGNLSPGMQQVQKFEDLLTDGKIKFTKAQKAGLEATIAELRTDVQKLDNLKKLLKATTELADLSKQFAAQDKEFASKIAADTAEQISMIEHGNADRRLENALKQIGIDYDKQRIELQKKYHDNDNLDTVDFLKDMAERNAAQKNATAQAIADFAKIKAAQADWKNGARSALEEYQTTAENVAQNVHDAIASALDGLTNAITDFVDHGKGDFKALADSIQQSITRMIVQGQIAKLTSPDGPLGGFLSKLGLGGAAAGDAGLAGAMSADTAATVANTLALTANTAAQALGGAAGAAGGLGGLANIFSAGSGSATDASAGIIGAIQDFIPGFASGGDIAAGQLSIVGEKGPEFFMPSRSGTIIPNGKLGGSVTNIINFANHGPPASKQTQQQLADMVGQATRRAQRDR